MDAQLYERLPAVFVVDDDAAVRESAALALRSLDVTLTCFRSAEDFLNSWDGPRPGCLLLDVRMPGMSGIELLKQLSQKESYLSIIIVTGHGTIPMSVSALNQGAFSFLEKPYLPAQLRKLVAHGLESASIRWEAWLREIEFQTKFQRLSPRERGVHALLLEGFESKQIAFKLRLSPSTVEKHRLAVLRKMETENIPLLLKQKVEATGTLVVDGTVGEKPDKIRA